MKDSPQGSHFSVSYFSNKTLGLRIYIHLCSASIWCWVCVPVQGTIPPQSPPPTTTTTTPQPSTAITTTPATASTDEATPSSTQAEAPASSARVTIDCRTDPLLPSGQDPGGFTIWRSTFADRAKDRVDEDVWDMLLDAFAGDVGQEFFGDASQEPSGDAGQFSSDAGQEFPNDVGQKFSNDDGQKFSSDAGQEFPSDAGQFSSDVGQNFSSDAGQKFSSDAGQEFPNDVGQKFSSDVGQKFSSDAGQEFPNDVGQKFSSDAGQKFSADASQESSNDAGQKFSADAGQEFPNDVGQKFFSDVSQDFTDDVGDKPSGDVSEEISTDEGDSGDVPGGEVPLTSSKVGEESSKNAGQQSANDSDAVCEHGDEICRPPEDVIPGRDDAPAKKKMETDAARDVSGLPHVSVSGSVSAGRVQFVLERARCRDAGEYFCSSNSGTSREVLNMLPVPGSVTMTTVSGDSVTDSVLTLKCSVFSTVEITWKWQCKPFQRPARTDSETDAATDVTTEAADDVTTDAVSADVATDAVPDVTRNAVDDAAFPDVTTEAVNDVTTRAAPDVTIHAFPDSITHTVPDVSERCTVPWTSVAQRALRTPDDRRPCRCCALYDGSGQLVCTGPLVQSGRSSGTNDAIPSSKPHEIPLPTTLIRDSSARVENDNVLFTTPNDVTSSAAESNGAVYANVPPRLETTLTSAKLRAADATGKSRSGTQIVLLVAVVAVLLLLGGILLVTFRLHAPGGSRLFHGRTGRRWWWRWRWRRWRNRDLLAVVWRNGNRLATGAVVVKIIDVKEAPVLKVAPKRNTVSPV